MLTIMTFLLSRKILKRIAKKISNYVLDKLVIVTDSEHIGYIDDDVRAFLQKSGFVHFDLALACEINNLIFVLATSSLNLELAILS